MKKLAVSTGLALLFVLCATPVYGAPALPHAFYGTVQINGIPAPIGTSVEARGEGVLTGIPYNPTITTVSGIYGTTEFDKPRLLVQGDIQDGAIITFYVNNVSTGQTAPWHSGATTELPLTVTIVATPTATPTVTPTVTPTATLTVTPTITPTPTPISSHVNGSIGASGGTVNTTDGNIWIEFPAGSFNTSTNVSIQGGACHAGSDDFVVGSTCFNVTPDGALGAAATICVNLSAYDFSIVNDKADIKLGYWSNGSWNLAGNITINGITLCGETTHLSDWAVLGSTVNGTPVPTSTPSASPTATPSGSQTPAVTSTATATLSPTQTPSDEDKSGTNWVLVAGIAGGTILLAAIVTALNRRSRGDKGKGEKKSHKPKQRSGNNKKDEPWDFK